LNAPNRPDWFFRKEQYGGIICDIGSHQIEQILHFSGATDAEISSAAVANYNNPDYPELEDFGEASLVTNNGVSGYFRVDWFTPDGLAVWGDGRTFILGTDGYMELRKYIDLLQDPEGDQIYLVNQTGAQHLSVRGQVGFPFFGQLILDCLNRTENAMTQAHAFKAAELCLQAQAMARKIA
jgi:predicted dehydrogenase